MYEDTNSRSLLCQDVITQIVNAEIALVTLVTVSTFMGNKFLYLLIVTAIIVLVIPELAPWLF